MSFFKKLTETVSKGVSTATEKAQQTVEITKLHAQISGKRKEIDRKYAEIGESVYKAYLGGDLSAAEADVIPACQQIADRERDIEALEDRIRELRNEKECECGQRVPFQTKFCPACGRKFPEQTAAVQAAETEVAVLHEAPEGAERAIEVFPGIDDEPEAPLEHAEGDVARAEEAEADEPAQPVMHICTACQAEMPPEARFCQDCGNPMYP